MFLMADKGLTSGHNNAQSLKNTVLKRTPVQGTLDST